MQAFLMTSCAGCVHDIGSKKHAEKVDRNDH